MKLRYLHCLRALYTLKETIDFSYRDIFENHFFVLVQQVECRDGFDIVKLFVGNGHPVVVGIYPICRHFRQMFSPLFDICIGIYGKYRKATDSGVAVTPRAISAGLPGMIRKEMKITMLAMSKVRA